MSSDTLADIAVGIIFLILAIFIGKVYRRDRDNEMFLTEMKKNNKKDM